MRVTLIAAMLAASLTASPAFPQTTVDPCGSPDGVRADNEAWASRSFDLFNKGDYRGAIANVNACMPRWAEQAEALQASLASASIPVGRVDGAARTAIYANGILNDVGSSRWLVGRANEALGDRAAAREAYTRCAQLTAARTWDLRGWFWSPASDCTARLGSGE